MRKGLIPLLDRLLDDIRRFAPSESVKSRLENIFIPEWNVYGGWVKPLAKGAALQGALAYSRTLHVFAERKEVVSAQHLGLFAPFPHPAMRSGFLTDIREGYFTVLGREGGTDFLRTALYFTCQLWSMAFASQVVAVDAQGIPALGNGVPVLDVTAFRTPDEKRLNLVLTNAAPSSLQGRVILRGFSARPRALRLTISGENLSAANTWQNPNGVQLQREEEASIGGREFLWTLPSYSIQALFLQPPSAQ